MNDLWRWLLGVKDLPVDAEGLRPAWERPLPSWGWVMVIGLAIAFAAWSYRGLDASPRRRTILTALRSVLLIVLVVCVCGPMLELPREDVEPDAVVVLVDRSRSMAVRDGERGPDGRATRESTLKSVLASAGDAWREPGESRRVSWIGFGDGAVELATVSETDPDTRTEASPIETGEPDAWRTRLAPALEEALRRTTGRPLAGVVILSDGRTEAPPDRELVRRLVSAAAPVHVIPLGAETPIGDASVARVEAPKRAFVRDAVPVVVRLDNRGRRGDVVVELVDDTSGRVLDSSMIAMNPDGEEMLETVLTARPGDGVVEGARRWSVRIAGDADLVPENDITSFPIELVDRPLRVLYIEGGPRWEYRYLKNLLVRETSIESSVMLLSADRDFAQEGNTPLARLPRDADEFAQFDLIVLGDVPAGFLTEARQKAIRELVERRGGGLVLLGGPRSMPGTWSESALASLVPFSGGFDLERRDGAVMMRPTEEAARLGVLRLDEESENGWPVDLSDPDYGWSRLQWVQRIDPERLKPTAEVLAEAISADDPTNQSETTPLVIGMRYGAGQVLYVATDEIWRWRYGRGETFHERFWIQLLRLLGREAIQSDVPVRLAATPERAVVGRPVLVTVDLLDGSLGIDPPETVFVEARDSDGEIAVTAELARAAESSWTGTFIPERLGPLDIVVSEPGLAAIAADSTVRIEVGRPDDELRLADADHALLASLAEQTGGAVHRIDDDRPVLDRVHEAIPNRAIVTESPIRERIWTSPLFFMLILLLAATEWSVRRLSRLD
jgi:hypothetical protein